MFSDDRKQGEGECDAVREDTNQGEETNIKPLLFVFLSGFACKKFHAKKQSRQRRKVI